MPKFYFTFGQIHVHRVNGKTFDHDCVVEIETSDYGSARQEMLDTFGSEWSFQYKELPDMKYFPRGIFHI